MLVDPTHPCVIVQVEYDVIGQVRARYTLDQGQRDGLAQTYDGAGNLRCQAGYKAGRLHGQATRYAPPAEPMAWIDAGYQRDLAAGAVSPELCRALAAKQIPLAGDEQIVVEEPGREWSLIQGGLIYTLQAAEGRLAISLGRVVERATFQDGWLVERAGYAGGALHGEHTFYTIPGWPLGVLYIIPGWCLGALPLGYQDALPPGHQGALPPGTIPSLPPGYQGALEVGDIPTLSRALARVGIGLGADARVSELLAGLEWLIEQPNGRAYSIWSAAQWLIVAPSRLVRRELFADGAVMSIASFKDGLLEGIMTQLAPVGKTLRPLGLAAQVALVSPDLAALNKQYQLSLPTYAQVFTEVPGIEWFIYAPEQSYSVRRVGPQLALSGGRVVQKAAYQAGRRMGETWLFADGRLQQCSSAQDGELRHVTIYRGGKKQSNAAYSNGLQDGPSLTYDDQGRIASSATYKAGRLEGELALYQDGRVVSRAQYHAGLQEGLSQTYDDQEHVTSSTNYLAGRLEGEQALYQDERVVSQTQYKDGKKQGMSLSLYDQQGHLMEKRNYDQQGHLVEKCSYRNTQLDGIALHYFPTGKIQRVAVYRMGQQIGPAVELNEAGHLIALCGYIRGAIVGIAVTYYPDGYKKEETYYDKDGKKMGVIEYDAIGAQVSSNIPEDCNLPEGQQLDSGVDKEVSVLTYQAGRLNEIFLVRNREGNFIVSGRCSQEARDIDITIFDPPGVISQELGAAALPRRQPRSKRR